jgi:hypothetical protein
MRHSLQRIPSIALAAVLGLIGATAFASAASAQAQPNKLKVDVRVQGCAFTGCTQDALVVLANTTVTTFCVRGDYNVTYTGPSTGRGGFVDRRKLNTPTAQTESCDSAGVFAQVGVGSVNLRPCNSSNCVDIGDAFRDDPVGVFCRLGPSNDRWYLIFDNDTRHAGFLPASALRTAVNVPACT